MNNLSAPSSVSFSPKHTKIAQEILNEYLQADQHEKYELLLEIARKLPSFATLKDAERVKGCMSDVWISYQAPDTWRMQSDSRIIQGILFFIWCILDGGAHDQALINIKNLMKHLEGILMPHRAQGLMAIYKHIEHTLHQDHEQPRLIKR